MWTFILWAVGIIVVIAILKAVISALIEEYPWLMFALPLLAFVVLWILGSWGFGIAAAVIIFIALAILGPSADKPTCVNCGSYKVERVYLDEFEYYSLRWTGKHQQPRYEDVCYIYKCKECRTHTVKTTHN